MATLTGGLALTWLGHATWLIKTPGGKRLLFDPWTDGNPMCPAAFKGDGVDPLDLILVTHGHGDHIGDLVATAKRTSAPVIAIFEITAWLESKGVMGSIGMNKGGTVPVGNLKVTMVNAVHSSAFVDDGRLVDMGDPAGFVVEMENGYTIYNAGDTAVFGDMALIAELYEPDLAILPIGDHFTMGPKEAAKAIELLGVKLVVPQHFATFPLLTGTPRAVAELVPSDVTVFQIGPGDTIT